MGSRLAHVLNQASIELKVFSRQKILLFWSFVFPLLFLFGFSIDRTSLDFIFPGMIVTALLTTCVSNTVPLIVSERRYRLYKRLRVTPLKRSTLIAAKLISRYVVVIAQMVVMFTVAGLVFNIWPHGQLWELASLISLGAVCLLSVAFFVAGIVRDEHAANIVSMIVFFTLAFGSNTFFSIDLYPPEIQPVIGMLPTTHMATALREMIAGPASPRTLLPALGWIGAYWLVFTALSIKFFNWEED